jgi:hypothetical protein
MAASRNGVAHRAFSSPQSPRKTKCGAEASLAAARGLEKWLQTRVLHKLMHEQLLAAAHRLSDDALIARLKTLVAKEREATIDLVAHLAELCSRRLDLGEGQGDLYLYCREVLGISEDAAYNRACAARAVGRFPVILGMLADGSLTLTAVRLLRPLLTTQNHREVLAEARHRSRAEVEKIVARLKPQPDVPSSIRKLPAPAPQVALPPPLTSQPNEAPVPAVYVAPPPPSHRQVIAPLSPERYRLQLTIDEETRDALRQLQDLLRREFPSGDPAALIKDALLRRLREAERTKMKATTRTRRPRGTKEGSRDVPAAVARAVWKRDGQRCAFSGPAGRCAARSFLELHHIQPYGHQGPATVENISVRCRAHNVFESELVFGPFDASIARESRENYAVSGQIPPVPKRRSGRGVPGRTGTWTRTNC